MVFTELFRGARRRYVTCLDFEVANRSARNAPCKEELAALDQTRACPQLRKGARLPNPWRGRGFGFALKEYRPGRYPAIRDVSAIDLG